MKIEPVIIIIISKKSQYTRCQILHSQLKQLALRVCLILSVKYDVLPLSSETVPLVNTNFHHLLIWHGD